MAIFDAKQLNFDWTWDHELITRGIPMKVFWYFEFYFLKGVRPLRCKDITLTFYDWPCYDLFLRCLYKTEFMGISLVHIDSFFFIKILRVKIVLLLESRVLGNKTVVENTANNLFNPFNWNEAMWSMILFCARIL